MLISFFIFYFFHLLLILSFLSFFYLQNIAAGCVNVAAKILNVQLPLNFETPWFEVFNISKEILDGKIFLLFILCK